jgi:tetratricopeptide (TPR) repeat protein
LFSFNSQKAQLPYLQEIRDKLGIGQTSKAISTKQLSVVTSSLLVISGFFIFYSNIEPAISNIKTFRAVESFLQTRSVTTEVGLLEQALARKTPYIFDLTNEVTKSVGPVISKRLHFLPRSVVSSSLNLLITKQTDNTKIHPLDPRIFMALAKLWQINFLFTNNRDHLLESEMLLEQAIKLSPKRQQIFFLLADLRFSLNKKDEGIDAFEQAYHLDPIVGESVWRLAWAYFVVGKIEESCAIISKGKAQGAHYSYGQLGLEIITPILAECEQITKQ